VKWRDNYKTGHSTARLGGLLLRIYQEEGTWISEVIQGKKLLFRIGGGRGIGEASLIAAMWAKGFLEGLKKNAQT
jgi:hypothetical protein